MEKFLKMHIIHQFLIFFSHNSLGNIHLVPVTSYPVPPDRLTSDHTCSKQDCKGELTDSCKHLQVNTAQTEEELKRWERFFYLQNERHPRFM